MTERDRTEADDAARWKEALHSVHGDCVSTARQEMDGRRAAPRDEATRRLILELVNVAGSLVEEEIGSRDSGRL